MLLSTIKCGPLQRCGQETEPAGGGWAAVALTHLTLTCLSLCTGIWGPF